MPLFDGKDKSRYATFTRRTLMVGGGVASLFAVLAGRLYQLQIVDGKEYMIEADDNRISQRLLFPPRGRILDRFGVELATNKRSYRALIIAEQARAGIKSVLEEVGKTITLPPFQIEKVLHEVAINKAFTPVPIAENLTWEEFSRLEMLLPYLPGVQPDVGQTRSYPYGPDLVHVIGYVAAVSPADQKRDSDPLLSQPGFRIGKRGIEKEYDKQMRGEAGVSRVEVNAYGRIVRKLSRDPGTPGQDVWLTIDRDLQEYAYQQLTGQSAACVVMDVQNGDVLALASAPGYDPDLFNVGISDAQWRALLDNEQKPLLNKAISGTYPPGSTFKTAVSLAAVDNGLGDFTVNCTGSMRLGNHIFYCDAWRIGGHGHVDLERGIQVSCDIFFYQVAMRLGMDKMAAAARTIGLGSPTGIELPGERDGLIPTTEWKRKRFGVPWQEGESLVNAIGQGYVLATPIQLCMQAARLATGKAVLPRLVHQVGAVLEPRPAPEPLPFSQAAFEAVRAGMYAAVNEPGGTAYYYRIQEPGFAMAGKTGTAQVRRITAEERAQGLSSESQLPWKYREHALFIGFAPADNPRYAASVVVEHGGARSEPQVALAANIMRYVQQRQVAQLPTAYPVQSASTAKGHKA